MAVREFANPSSSHGAGQHATHYIETAREQIAAAAGTLFVEIVFTNGATERNNQEQPRGAISAIRDDADNVLSRLLRNWRRPVP